MDKGITANPTPNIQQQGTMAKPKQEVRKLNEASKILKHRLRCT